MQRIIFLTLMSVLLLSGCRSIPPTIDNSTLPSTEREEFLKLRELEDRVLSDYESRLESLQKRNLLLEQLKIAEKSGSMEQLDALQVELEFQDRVVDVRLAEMMLSISELEAEKAKLMQQHEMLHNGYELTDYVEYRDDVAEKLNSLKELLELVKQKRETRYEQTGDEK